MTSQPHSSPAAEPGSSLPERRGRVSAGAPEPRPSRLPGSDELFRRTTPRATEVAEPGIRVVPPAPSSPERRSTGRERHDEKITVYVSNDELIDLEHARLTLKRLGVKADRGRIVRIALTELIEDLERNRESAVLVQRLRSE